MKMGIAVIKSTANKNCCTTVGDRKRHKQWQILGVLLTQPYFRLLCFRHLSRTYNIRRTINKTQLFDMQYLTCLLINYLSKFDYDLHYLPVSNHDCTFIDLIWKQLRLTIFEFDGTFIHTHMHIHKPCSCFYVYESVKYYVCTLHRFMWHPLKSMLCLLTKNSLYFKVFCYK